MLLTDDDLTRLRRVLGAAAGLVFEDSRRDSLAGSVLERLRRTGSQDVGGYLGLLEQAGSPELQPLLDEVTIQETHFLRNPPQVRALADQVLPELLRIAEIRGRRLRIWSAGCSTGDEPYTIAMLLRELLPTTAGWDVKVIGTDISEGALALAAEATYGPRALRLVSPERRARFFTPMSDGRYAVRDEVRELVEFRRHNLVHDRPPGDGLDLVLCRNVTIYFNRDTTRALVRRFHSSLRDGGFLFLGHSETLWQISEDFRLVALGSGDSAAFVYRRQDAATSPGATSTGRTPLTAPREPVPRQAESQARPINGPPATVPLDDGSYDVRVAAVREALATGRYDDATRLALRAAEAAPLRAEAHYLLGLALVELGRDDQARAALRRAVYLEPAAGLAHFLLAGALARCGDRAAAAREYRAAAQTLAHDPGGTMAPELGGRSVRELAELCAQIGTQLEAQLASGTA